MKVDNGKALKALFSFTKGSRISFFAAIAATLIASVLSLLDPLVVRGLLDGLASGEMPAFAAEVLSFLGMGGGLAGAVALAAIMILAFHLSSGAFLFLRGLFSASAAEGAALRLRRRLFAKILALPYRYHRGANPGDLIQRSTSDVETIRRFLQSQIEELSRSAFMCAAVIAFMVSLDPGMALVCLSLVPLIFGFSVLFFMKIQKAFERSDQAESEMTSVLQEFLSNVRVVKAFARGDYEEGRFEAKNAAYRDTTTGLIDLFGWYWSISSLLCMLQSGIVLCAGGWAAATGAISLGTMISFFAYTGRLLWPVRQLGRVLTELGKVLVSSGRVQEILSLDDEGERGGTRFGPVRGEIRLEGVSLSFEGRKALEGIDLTIAPGETLAILGKAGSGKSCLASLLSRLERPDEGRVLLDGRDIAAMDASWLRRRVAVVLQEPFLFSRSLGDNLKVAAPGAADEALDAAIDDACLRETLSAFKDGLATAVGEEGVTLSGGQRQRVAIARSLLLDPDVLVLDDSLSAVDTETDKRIREALAARRGARTTVIITHRVSTLAKADRILVLEDGKIAALGSHAELSAREGLYRRLWLIQSDLESELEAELSAGPSAEGLAAS